MKVFKKINWLLGTCALMVTVLFAVDPTLIKGTCCGFCLGMFVSDTIINWYKR